jgi:hypothetical protein
MSLLVTAFGGALRFQRSSKLKCDAEGWVGIRLAA